MRRLTAEAMRWAGYVPRNQLREPIKWSGSDVVLGAGLLSAVLWSASSMLTLAGLAVLVLSILLQQPPSKVAEQQYPATITVYRLDAKPVVFRLSEEPEWLERFVAANPEHAFTDTP